MLDSAQGGSSETMHLEGCLWHPRDNGSHTFPVEASPSLKFRIRPGGYSG